MTTTPPSEPRAGDRIAKLLARAGIASRREVERMIAEGRVKIGEEIVSTPATVLSSLAGVTVDGKPVRAAETTRLFGFHKPSGVITAERDPAGRPTIYNALRNALPSGTPRVMPVGRLDLNTEGLLLLTNDGELKRALELPSSGVPRTYRARTFGDITQARLEELMDGIEIEGVRYGPINANMERRTGRNQWIELTLTEGKNREVRRVLEHLGLQVSRLLRVSYGPFLLGELPRGMAVEINPADVERFRRALGLAPQEPRAGRPAAEKARPTKAEPEGRRKAHSPAPRRKTTREDEGDLLSRSELSRRNAPARPGTARATGKLPRRPAGKPQGGPAPGGRPGGGRKGRP